MFKNKGIHIHYNDIKIGNNIIDRVGDSCKEKCFRFLGHWVDENLTWQFHLNKMQSKLISANYALSTCKYSVPLRIRKLIYKSLFESHIHFGSVVYGSCDPKLLTNILTIQKRAVRSLSCAKYRAHTDPLFKIHKILKATDLISLNQCLLIHKFRSNKLPSTFKSFFEHSPSNSAVGITYSDYNYPHHPINVKTLCHFPHYQSVKSWNFTNLNY